MNRAISPDVSERDFQRTVIEFLHVMGFRVAHFRPALTKHGWVTPVQADGAGFPDILAVRKGLCLAVELKSAKGRLAPLQERWLRAWAEVPGCRAAVWRPADFPQVVKDVQEIVLAQEDARPVPGSLWIDGDTVRPVR